MIKQALNAATIANIMRTFVKDDAIKLLGKSTYNKWVKKLPSSRIARGNDADALLKMLGDRARVLDADRLRRTQAIEEDLVNHYGPSFVSNLPRVNSRLNTRGRLKGARLRALPRVNYLREFTDRNKLVSRNELLRWNRVYKAGLDPKTLTSEWYVKPTAGWGGNDAVSILHKTRLAPNEGAFSYNGKTISADTAYHRAQLVRNIAAVPYTDPIRHTADRLVANELHKTLHSNVWYRSLYNSVSDNTRKVLNYISGRNVLEDPRSLRLVNSANKHGRLYVDIGTEFKNGNNAVFLPDHNIVAAHPRLTQNVKNHERSHELLYNMNTQEHADIASRTFRGINAISRKNPRYSNLASKLIELPHKAHEAVTDYYRHKLYGTLGSRVDDFKSMGTLNTDLRLTEPAINHIVYETQKLTSNPSLQQALQQLAINYNVSLRNRAINWESIKQQLRGLF